MKQGTLILSANEYRNPRPGIITRLRCRPTETYGAMKLEFQILPLLANTTSCSNVTRREARRVRVLPLRGTSGKDRVGKYGKIMPCMLAQHLLIVIQAIANAKGEGRRVSCFITRDAQSFDPVLVKIDTAQDWGSMPDPGQRRSVSALVIHHILDLDDVRDTSYAAFQMLHARSAVVLQLLASPAKIIVLTR